MLLDPFEEQFDLPTALVERADGRGRQPELVGEEYQRFSGFGVPEADAPEVFGIMPAGVVTVQSDGPPMEGQIMANYRVISSDNHVSESPDLWTSRARPVFKDRVPQLVREYDGDWWFCNGHRVIGLAAGAQTGMRFEAPEQLVRTTTFDKVRRGGYDP